LNIHHLELFYFVARHGGISEAVRKIPYGIQQPAVSAQILQLEADLGVKLFQRRPFCLSPAGDKLFHFIQPFFHNLETIAEEIRHGGKSTLRLGASEIVLREHLPALMQDVREQFPKLRLILRSAYQPELIEALKKEEIDIAVTLLEENLPSNIHTITLLKLPILLLVSRKSKLKDAEVLFKQKIIREPLLCLPPGEIVCRKFQEWLRQRGIEWAPTAELSSLELIQTYVESGYGIGLTVAVPRATLPSTLRALSLKDFPPVELAALWRGENTPLVQTVIQAVQRRAAEVTNLGRAGNGLPESELVRRTMA
jgi:DNA-binding transcriptional LysR family regulator